MKHTHHTTGRYHKGCPACKAEKAAPTLAEALRNFVDYYTQAGIGGCADGHDDDDDDGPFSGDERYNVRHARAALKLAGIKE